MNRKASAPPSNPTGPAAAQEASPPTGERDLITRFAPSVAAAVVRALGATLRLRVAGLEPLRPLWSSRRPLIYMIWHGDILLAPWLNERLRRVSGARRAVVLASQSRDGERIARFAACFGLPAVRGSSSRGGRAALHGLARAIADGEDVVIVPDGPRGPRCELQPGVAALAAWSGAPVVPLAIAARPARRLQTWDRFLLPIPFGRAAAAFGPPIAVARSADRDEARRQLAGALDDTTASAHALVGGR